MLLTETTIDDLWALLRPHMGAPAWPGLDDPDLPKRARRESKKDGLWAYLDETLDTDRKIEVIYYSRYRSLKRGGPHLDDRSMMTFEVRKAAMALWLEHPKASAAYLEDLLWAACETSTWVGSFHEYCGLLDLTSTTMAALYAELLYLVGNRLDDEVVARVRKEIRQRVLDPGIDYRQTPWWATVPMNWNLVCNCNLITAALYELGDVFIAHYLHPVVQRLHYGLGGFAEDGGCYEGPGYWEYAFSHYLKAAVMLQHRTGGQVNLMAEPWLEGVCRFPLATALGEGKRLTFCDSGHGYLSSETVKQINRFYDIPELWTLTAPRRNDPAALTPKSMPDWRHYTRPPRPRPAKPKPSLADYLYPALGLAKVRPAQAPQDAVLGVFACHNDCPHNHNDVGTFIYSRAGQLPLTDPGSPKYNAKVFGAHRYEHPHTRTLGHSLPIVNGHEQAPGREYRGELEAHGLNGDGEKVIVAHIEQAYPDPTLKRLQRRFVLADDGALTLTDTFAFDRRPRSLEEGFATYETTRLRCQGREVRIGTGDGSVVLKASADTPGRFRVDTWGPEAETWTTDRRLRRIVFTPEALDKEMELTFHVS